MSLQGTQAAAVPAGVSRAWNEVGRFPRPRPTLSLRPDANGHRASGLHLRPAGVHRERLQVEYPSGGPSLLAASMGSCLSSPQPASPPLAQVRPALWPPRLTRAQDSAHRGRGVSAGPFPQVPRDWVSPKPGEVMEALRYLRAQSPPETTVGPGSYEGWRLWSVQHPRRLSNPVTIKIAPPERQGRPCAPPEQGAPAAGSPPSEDHPDPVAKETIMWARNWARKGNRNFEEPLWFEIQGRKIQTRDLEPRPSAFKPLVGTGAVPCFSPKPGRLGRSRCPWSLRPWSYNVHQEDPSRRRAASPLATAPGQGAEPQLDT